MSIASSGSEVRSNFFNRPAVTGLTRAAEAMEEDRSSGETVLPPSAQDSGRASGKGRRSKRSIRLTLTSSFQ